jgi:drug/metabolite transporter (DMT)-like permease
MSTGGISVGTVVGIVLCWLCVALVLSGVRWAQPKNNKIVLAALIVAWYWTTTIWAMGTKQITKDLGDKDIYPSTSFWLTMIPQLVASACVVPIAAAKGVKLWEGTLWPARTDGGMPRIAWLAAGAGFFFGQFFTVLSLAAAAPSICFVIKAIEPLTTALLAIPTLRQSVNWRLLLAISVSCVGIVITALGSSHAGSGHGGHPDRVGVAIICAFLCNCGFSSRACVVKKANAQGNVPGVEMFGKVSVAASAWGIAMLIMWLVILFFHPHSATYRDSFDGLVEVWEHHLGTWLAMSCCYFLYQCASLLLLDCFIVESHALLVGMKHIFTVVLASVLIHSPLSALAIVGVVIAAAGVVWYAVTPPPVASREEKAPILPQDEVLKKVGRPAFGDLPPVLIGIVGALAMLGIISPSVHALRQ